MADCEYLHRLIAKIPLAPRGETKVEEIARFTGDDPLDGAGHGVYGWLGRPAQIPKEVQLEQHLAAIPNMQGKHMAALRFDADWKKKHAPMKRPLRWNRNS